MTAVLQHQRRCRPCEMQGGGFTLEVQNLSEGLCRGPEVKAFARVLL
jgi:hypothetical protein